MEKRVHWVLEEVVYIEKLVCFEVSGVFGCWLTPKHCNFLLFELGVLLYMDLPTNSKARWVLVLLLIHLTIYIHICKHIEEPYTCLGFIFVKENLTVGFMNEVCIESLILFHIMIQK